MVDLKLYIDNDSVMYKDKVAIFKKMYSELGAKKLDVNKYPSWVLTAFSRLIAKAKVYAKKYDDGEVSLSDETDALKELVQEYNVEVVELKNFAW